MVLLLVSYLNTQLTPEYLRQFRASIEAEREALVTEMQQHRAQAETLRRSPPIKREDADWVQGRPATVPKEGTFNTQNADRPHFSTAHAHRDF